MKKGLIIILVISVIGAILTSGCMMFNSSQKGAIFEDANLEYAVRGVLDNLTGDVSLQDIQGITELDASNRGIRSLKGIEALSGIVKLNLEGNEIKDVSPLSKLVALKDLNLENNGIIYLSAIGFDALAKLPELKELKLGNNGINLGEESETKLSDISILKDFINLKELDLKGNDVKDISPLSSLVKLKELNLSGNKISNGDIEILRTLSNLEELNIRECNVVDISPIEDIENLVYLNIHSNEGIKSIEPIGKLTKLETLIMRNVNVGDQIEILENLTNLKVLNLRNTSISDVSVLAKLMEKGALQDDAVTQVYADVDIRDNPIPLIPQDNNNGYESIKPYWDNIEIRNPEDMPQRPTQKVLINEVMGSNDSTIADPNGNYNDWIELYNPGDTAVDLSGFYLSDKEKDLGKWKFPERTSIPAKGYLVVWASGEGYSANTGLYANFKISADGETLILTEPDGKTWSDYLVVPSGQKDISYGRQPDGSGQWGQFDVNNATPGKTNNQAQAYEKPDEIELKFSHAGGFYTEDFFLQLSVDDPEAKIYYTLDGSEPDLGNLNGEGEGYYVKYSYNKDSDESDELVKKKNITYVYDSNPIAITSREGEPNDISMIPSAPMFGSPKKEIPKACVVRARLYKEGTFLGNTETHTFFVGKKYTLPVVSITTDADNLFDYEKGIYVPGKIYDDNYDPDDEVWDSKANYNRRGDSWEKPAHFEFFETTGTLGFAQDIGVKMHGGASRSIKQKTLRIHASDKYDTQNNIEYELFPGLTNVPEGDTLDVFKFFILRNSGNESMNTFFRDAMAQSLVSHTSLDTQAYRPAIVYLNGEYWGVHNLRERQDEHYLKNKYGINKDDVVILSTKALLVEGEEGDEKHYNEMLDFIKSNDMSDNDNYEIVKTLMDTDNYIEYYIAEIYFNNTDWPHNNIKYWRYKYGSNEPGIPYGQDGRWRWLLYDTDFGFGWKEAVDYNMFDWTTGNIKNEWSNTLFYSMLNNESFKNQFISRFADHLNTSFRSERVVQKISEMHSVLRPEMPVHNKRWNAIYGWNSQTRVMIDFAKQRPDYQRQHIIDFFNLDGTAELKLNTNAEDGLIKLNSIEISKNTPGVEDPNSWTGIYFKGIPVEIEGLPNLGYRFARWESNIQNEKIENNNKISLIPNQDIEITAIFEIATAQPAEEAIEKLPSVERITLEFENDVKLARNLVERTLSESKIGKSDISNIDKLMRLESRIFELKKFEEAKSQKSLRKKFFKW